MAFLRADTIFTRMNDYEINLCLYINRVSKYFAIKQFFRFISRLGNGVFWYSLIIALPFMFGTAALSASLHMMIVGALTLLVYKLLKKVTVRTRPCLLNENVNMGTAPLDQYSFPSGHTMHAVSFSIVAINYYPILALYLVPFTLLVMLSRVILGLHYPSDVLVGALLGGVFAYTSLLF